MNIVILHCHFERGGVTQVVENHVRALRQTGDAVQITLVAGARAGGLSAETISSTKRIEVDDFDYDSADILTTSGDERAAQLAKNLEHSLRAAKIRPDDSVLHWHNHSLGKNTAAPAVIRRLAQSGWRMLLQIHDFAEDYRPELYRGLIDSRSAASKAELDAFLYPVASNIHYAALTRADTSVIRSLGVVQSQTHCLPNCVALQPGSGHDREQSLTLVRRAMDLPEDARWCLYPVRGIRRKNVGEFLLLSRWIPENMFAGLTLSPATTVENRSYERWRKVASDAAPRAVFDAAHHEGVTYTDNLSASEFILSTSVAEGFGMAYLEPWLADRGVVARRLPTVTDDFQAAGVQLSALYDAIPIPGDDDWLRQCRRETQNALQEAWSDVAPQFRPQLDNDEDEGSDTIDFAKLHPARQTEVLKRACDSHDYESTLKSLSAKLIGQLACPPDDDLIHRNAQIVASQYAVDAQGEQLMSIYQQLLSGDVSEVDAPENAGDAVDLVADARPFYPCRTEWLPDA